MNMRLSRGKQSEKPTGPRNRRAQTTHCCTSFEIRDSSGNTTPLTNYELSVIVKRMKISGNLARARSHPIPRLTIMAQKVAVEKQLIVYPLVDGPACQKVRWLLISLQKLVGTSLNSKRVLSGTQSGPSPSETKTVHLTWHGTLHRRGIPLQFTL